MRVIFTQHFADNTRALFVGAVGTDTHIVHRVEDAPMYRFQAITRVWQRAGHDDAHGVIEVSAAHFLINSYLAYKTTVHSKMSLKSGWCFSVACSGVCQHSREEVRPCQILNTCSYYNTGKAACSMLCLPVRMFYRLLQCCFCRFPKCRIAAHEIFMVAQRSSAVVFYQP